MLFGVARSAELTDSTCGGYESATEERVEAKDKNGMWPRSFHNNPFSKLLLLLKVISKKDTSVPCSISQPCNAKLKSRTMARLCSSLLQVGAHMEPCSTRVTVTPSSTGASLWLRGERGLLGWGWWRSLMGPWPLLLLLGERGEGKGR